MVFIFLQNVRATIIPLLTVPVSIIGTFIFFPMLGFSVNTLSMFGLVLAIGIVVDDAIVVVEAVMHHMEHGLDPREATIQAMKEVSAPGHRDRPHPVGRVRPRRLPRRPHRPDVPAVRADHRHLGAALGLQRAVALAGALRDAPQARPRARARGPLGMFFRGFNWVFDRATNGYVGVARLLVRRAVLTILLVGVGGRRRRPLRHARSRPGSSPTRIRGSSASTCSSRPARPSSGRAPC